MICVGAGVRTDDCSDEISNTALWHTSSARNNPMMSGIHSLVVGRFPQTSAKYPELRHPAEAEDD
jgi:hypothetical protein